MQIRKDPLVKGCYYHIYNRSIAGYRIFNTPSDFHRITRLINLYRYSDFPVKYSRFTELDTPLQDKIIKSINKEKKMNVQIVAYCIMQTHFHLLLEQKQDDGITKYIGKILNSYTKYFNIKHKRSGPLWAGRFKSVLVESDAQLLQLTRYIHLNPVAAKLVKKTEGWEYSSYHEYIAKKPNLGLMINNMGLFDFTPNSYKEFVCDQKSYERELPLIESLLIEEENAP